MNIKKVSIIGFGRFGKVLYELLKDDYDVTIYYRKQKTIQGAQRSHSTKITKKLSDAYENDTIFLAVPISEFEKVLQGHKKYLKNQLLIDVLSVKMHPAEVFRTHLLTFHT